MQFFVIRHFLELKQSLQNMPSTNCLNSHLQFRGYFNCKTNVNVFIVCWISGPCSHDWMETKSATLS